MTILSSKLCGRLKSQISQGSAATDYRTDSKFYSSFFYRLPQVYISKYKSEIIIKNRPTFAKGIYHTRTTWAF